MTIAKFDMKLNETDPQAVELYQTNGIAPTLTAVIHIDTFLELGGPKFRELEGLLSRGNTISVAMVELDDDGNIK
jgi:hypothetical protein